MNTTPARVAVLGSGSWGTALALQLARTGHTVNLWGNDPGEIAAIRADGANHRYLPGITLPDSIRATNDLAAALAGCADCLIVVPSHAFGDMVRRLSEHWPSGHGVAWATKGLDTATGRLLHTLAAEALGERALAVISGPTFAGEVAAGLPGAVTVAAHDETFARRIAARLHGERFRVYTSNDLVGVEFCGAAKNVLAIATGIADGLGFGANTRAALITRGLAELIRAGTLLGGRTETFMGLAGLGDLVLTCTDDQSRNRRMGLALARGLGIEAARAEIGQEVEGVITAQAIRRLANELEVEMPISEQVYRVLHEGASPTEATRALLERDPKAEFV